MASDMIDIDTVVVVEIEVTTDGKIWVNVDGRCKLRIGKPETVIVDDPIRGKDVVFQRYPAKSDPELPLGIPLGMTDQPASDDYSAELPKRPGVGDFAQPTRHTKINNGE